MLTKYIAVFLIVGTILVGNLSLIHSVSAETLVQSTVDTRLVMWLRVGQAELQNLLPAPWQVNPIPGGPLKEANFIIVFIDSFLVQDAQGKPDQGGIARKAVFAVPKACKPVRWPLVTGRNCRTVKMCLAPTRILVMLLFSEADSKVVNIEAGVNEDFWKYEIIEEPSKAVSSTRQPSLHGLRRNKNYIRPWSRVFTVSTELIRLRTSSRVSLPV
jgi:hypothetical protein